MTWLYYTSYAGFWRADVLSHGVFWQTVRDDILAVLVQPASYFVKPAYIRAPVLALVLFVMMTVMTFRGGVRLASSMGWQPIHIALGFYLLPILMWNYGVMDRFLLPFLPLIFAGMWWEAQQVVHRVRSASGGKRRAEAAIVACFFGIAGVALLAGIGASWSGRFVPLRGRVNRELSCSWKSEKPTTGWEKIVRAMRCRLRTKTQACFCTPEDRRFAPLYFRRRA